MKKRALFSLFASIAATACFACGCGGKIDSSIIILDGETTADTAVLSVYGHKTDRYFVSAFEDVMQGFMSANSDVTVSYESAPETSYWQALDRRSDSGYLDDVFMIDRDRLISMTEKHMLADLSDSVNANVFSDFARSQLYSLDGAVYAIPASISTYGLYVNYDLLMQTHGKEIPKNYNEFKEVCNYFVSKGITPIVCNNYSSLRSLILARGLYDTYCTQDTETAIDGFNANPVSIAEPLNDGIDFVYEMIENGWIDLNETASTTHISGDLQAFATGEYPFMITGGWASSTLKAILEEKGNLRFGIHPYPILKRESSSEDGYVLVAQTDSLICVKNGENTAEAKKLAAMLSNPETLLKLSENQSCFTSLKEQTTLSYSDSAIIPSSNYYLNGKYVIGSDVNLEIPLDGILTECGKMIINGEEADAVKSHLLSLLEGVGK